MILGKLTAALGATALVLTLTACSGDDPAGKAPTVEVTPPPTLGDGDLEVALSHGEVPEGERLGATGLAITEDLVITIEQPGNTMAAYTRDEATEQWRTELPLDDVGADTCFDPLVPTPDTLVVFIGTYCNLVVAYDVATGKERRRTTLVSAYVDEAGRKHREATSPDDEPLGAAVTGAVTLDGRIWYSTQQEIGHLDDALEATPVFDHAALGLVDSASERSHPSALGVRAEDHLLVAEILVVNPASSAVDYRSRWLGITVDEAGVGEDPAARINWTLDQTDASTLGVGDLAPTDPEALLRATEPGAVVGIELSGQRVGLGLPDPATGKVGVAGVVPADREVSVTATGSSARTEMAWSKGTLFTTSDVPRETFRRWVDAWDLTTGKEKWRVQLPSPSHEGSADSYHVHSLQQAPDGALYAVATEVFEASTLYRLDPATGEVTGTWPLPKSMATAEFRVQVVDQTVVAIATEGEFEPIPSVMLLRTAPATPSP